MKLKIEKVPETGDVRIEFDPGPGAGKAAKSKPIAIVLGPAKIVLLQQLLETAIKSSVFTFEIEL